VSETTGKKPTRWGGKYRLKEETKIYLNGYKTVSYEIQKKIVYPSRFFFKKVEWEYISPVPSGWIGLKWPNTRAEYEKRIDAFYERYCSQSIVHQEPDKYTY